MMEDKAKLMIFTVVHCEWPGSDSLSSVMLVFHYSYVCTITFKMVSMFIAYKVVIIIITKYSWRQPTSYMPYIFNDGLCYWRVGVTIPHWNEQLECLWGSRSVYVPQKDAWVNDHGSINCSRFLSCMWLKKVMLKLSRSCRTCNILSVRTTYGAWEGWCLPGKRHLLMMNLKCCQTNKNNKCI